MRTLALALLLAALPALAHADDWLALDAPCAPGPRTRDRIGTTLVYPRTGLPAVVHAGTDLVFRVHVASGLTPPPGTQKDRALAGWSAELRGGGIALGPAIEHRYPLRVAEVWGEESASLVYRAVAPIPAWIAPGTYALHVTAPGGGDVAIAAVRVVASGARLRIGLAGTPAPAPEGADPVEHARTALSALARLPIDAWLAPDDPHVRAAIATAARDLERPLPPIALVSTDRSTHRTVVVTGSDALALGGCGSSDDAFDARARAIAIERGATLRTFDARQIPPAGHVATLRASRATERRPWPSPDELTVDRTTRSALRLALAPTARSPIELAILVPDDGRATTTGDAAVAWWPATPVVSSGFRRTLVGIVTVAPGARALVARRSSAPLRIDVVVKPSPATAGIPVELTVRGSRALQRVAWELDEDVTALGASARHRYRAPGLFPVHLVAIAEDGAAARRRVDVRVRTDARTCAAGGRPDPSFVIVLLGVGLVGTIRAMWARRRRNLGNTNRRRPR